MEHTQEHHVPAPAAGRLSLHFCGWENCAPGHSFGPAVRDHFLFHFILRGKGFYEAGGVRYSLEEGQGFLIFPGESTLYWADERKPWEYCWIGFDGEDAAEILQMCGLSREQPVYRDQSGGLLQKEMLALVEMFGQPENNALAMLGQLYRCLSRMVQKPSVPHSPGKAYADAGTAFIRRNYSYDIRVEDIARHVGIDRTYLYRIFRQELGRSPQQYLLEYRLQAAAKLLHTTSLSVTEVAFSCGFQEVSAFDRYFKRRYLLTPLAYRRRETTVK